MEMHILAFFPAPLTATLTAREADKIHGGTILVSCFSGDLQGRSTLILTHVTILTPRKCTGWPETLLETMALNGPPGHFLDWL